MSISVGSANGYSPGTKNIMPPQIKTNVYYKWVDVCCLSFWTDDLNDMGTLSRVRTPPSTRKSHTDSHCILCHRETGIIVTSAPMSIIPLSEICSGFEFIFLKRQVKMGRSDLCGSAEPKRFVVHRWIQNHYRLVLSALHLVQHLKRGLIGQFGSISRDVNWGRWSPEHGLDLSHKVRVDDSWKYKKPLGRGAGMA